MKNAVEKGFNFNVRETVRAERRSEEKKRKENTTILYARSVVDKKPLANQQINGFLSLSLSLGLSAQFAASAYAYERRIFLQTLHILMLLIQYKITVN